MWFSIRGPARAARRRKRQDQLRTGGQDLWGARNERAAGQGSFSSALQRASRGLCGKEFCHAGPPVAAKVRRPKVSGCRKQLKMKHLLPAPISRSVPLVAGG